MKNRIRILATSDVHGYIYPHQYSDNREAPLGFARLRTLIDSLRDENTLLIDNGDNLEGSPFAFYHYHVEYDQPSPVTAVMNLLEYDYVNIGNHDFNYGEKALMDHLGSLKAPLLTSNVLYKGRPLGPTYAIREIGGCRIALFGLVTHYIPNWEQPEHIRNFRFHDALITARRTVETIRRLEKPDYIICVYHGGFERDLRTGQPIEDLTGENQGYEILHQIPDIDVLITGHQHRSLAGRNLHSAYVQTADRGSELACIDIYTDTGEIEPRILTSDLEADEETCRLCQAEEDRCQAWLDKPLGTTTMDLTIDDEFEARLHKSQLITFLNHVQMEMTGAQLAGTALFPDATGFGRIITMRDLVSTYVFPNTPVVKQVSGRILRAYLEKCAEFWTISGERIAVSSRFVHPKPQLYNYDMIDGIDYRITVTNDVGHRITALTFQGEEVTDDMTFTLCVSNYRAAGGGMFDMIGQAPTVREYPFDMVAMLAEYIMSHKEISFTPVHNITVTR